MKIYQLVLKFADRNVTVEKKFKTNKLALFWAQLCLDICGKDENGKRYDCAILFDSAGKPVEGWK